MHVCSRSTLTKAWGHLCPVKAHLARFMQQSQAHISALKRCLKLLLAFLQQQAPEVELAPGPVCRLVRSVCDGVNKNIGSQYF